MTDIAPVITRLQDAAKLAPVGYALAFHIRYTSPTFMLQAYPQAWTTYYSLHALVMADPTVTWGFTHEGTRRWSDFTDDPARVMERAKPYGLNFGVVCATETDGSRSFGSFARSDREFTDAEVAELLAGLTALHDATRDIENLEPDTIERLRTMSIHYAKG